MKDILDILAQGGVAVYPTETLYALGCVATSHEAARRVAAIKGRSQAKPLPLIIGSLGQLGLVTHDAGGDLLALAESFWPGPVSLLVRAHEELSPLTRDEEGYTSVRVTSHPAAARLCAQLGTPLVATSANRGGCPPVARPEDLDPLLLEKVDGMLGDKPWPSGGPPSTVVRIVGPGRLKVLRLGAVTVKGLEGAGFQCEYVRAV